MSQIEIIHSMKQNVILRTKEHRNLTLSVAANSLPIHFRIVAEILHVGFFSPDMEKPVPSISCIRRWNANKKHSCTVTSHLQ